MIRPDFAKGREGVSKIGGFTPKRKGEKRIRGGSLHGMRVVRRRIDKAHKAEEKNDGITGLIVDVPRQRKDSRADV